MILMWIVRAKLKKTKYYTALHNILIVYYIGTGISVVDKHTSTGSLIIYIIYSDFVDIQTKTLWSWSFFLQQRDICHEQQVIEKRRQTLPVGSAGFSCV